MKRVVCSLPGCGKLYMSAFSYRRHLESDHYGVTKFSCAGCGRPFVYKHSLTAHWKKYAAHRPRESGALVQIQIPKLTDMIVVCRGY